RRDIGVLSSRHGRARPGHLRLSLFDSILGSRSARPRMTLTTLGSLGPLCSVLGATLLSVLHALGVEHAAQDVVAHAREVLHAAAADHHHRVLLQIVALARYVADDLEAVGEPHLGDLA